MEKSGEEKAAEYACLGDARAEQGLYAQAERQYLLALREYESLLQATGESIWRDRLRDLCLTLADLAMDQGNLHGADVYYVLAMKWERAEI